MATVSPKHGLLCEGKICWGCSSERITPSPVQKPSVKIWVPAKMVLAWASKIKAPSRQQKTEAMGPPPQAFRLTLAISSSSNLPEDLKQLDAHADEQRSRMLKQLGTIVLTGGSLQGTKHARDTDHGEGPSKRRSSHLTVLT